MGRFPAYTLSELMDGPDGLELLRMVKIEALAHPPEDQAGAGPAGPDEWDEGGEW